MTEALIDKLASLADAAKIESDDWTSSSLLDSAFPRAAFVPAPKQLSLL